MTEIDIKMITLEEEIANSTQSGLPDGWTRATFIVDKELNEKIKALAYWNRLTIKEVVNDALTQFVMNKVTNKDKDQPKQSIEEDENDSDSGRINPQLSCTITPEDKELLTGLSLWASNREKKVTNTSTVIRALIRSGVQHKDELTFGDDPEEDHRLTLRIPQKLLARVDAKRKERIGTISRNLWILELIDEATKP